MPTKSGPRWWRTSGRSSSPRVTRVADGDTLVILESMKMEIPVLAESRRHGGRARGRRGRRRPGGRPARRPGRSSRRPAAQGPRAGRPDTSHVSGSSLCRSCRSCAPSVEVGGSDLHCKVGSPPRVRIDGTLRKLQAPHADARRHRAHGQRGAPRGPASRSSPGPTRPTSPTRVPGVGRFRVNAFRARGARPAWCSAGSASAPSRWTSSACPPVLGALALEPRGLVLVTGPTGSGKTTTLAGMIDHINTQPRGPHRHDRGPDRGPALRQAVDGQPARGPASTPRTSPPRCAPRCARTPTSSSSARCATTRPSRRRWRPPRPVTSSCRRCTPPTRRRRSTAIIDFFPPHEQKQVRLALAGALRGIICQRLVPRADGAGPLRRRWRSASTPAASPTRSPTRTRPATITAADRGGRLLRHADLRPAPGRADPGRRHHARGRDGRRRPARTTSPSSCAAWASSPDARPAGQPVVVTPCSTHRAVQPVGSTCTTIRRRHFAQYRGGSMPAPLGAGPVVEGRTVTALVAPGLLVHHGRRLAR